MFYNNVLLCKHKRSFKNKNEKGYMKNKNIMKKRFFGGFWCLSGFGLLMVFLITVCFSSVGSYAAGIGNAAFVDKNFYECVVRRFNELNPGVLDTVTYETVLTDAQLASIHALNCNHNSVPLRDEVGLPSQYTATESISDTAGLEKMTRLQKLLIGGHSELVSIDLSHNVLLEKVALRRNNLSSLDLSGLSALQSIDVRENHLTSLAINDQQNLLRLLVEGNQLQVLDLTNNTKLEMLGITRNNISQIDLSMLPELTLLDVSDSVRIKPYVEYHINDECVLTAVLKLIDYVAAAGLEQSDNYSFDLQTHTMTFKSRPINNTVTVIDPHYDDEGARDFVMDFGARLEEEFNKVNICKSNGPNEPSEPVSENPVISNSSDIDVPNTGVNSDDDDGALVITVSFLSLTTVLILTTVSIYVFIRYKNRVDF